MALARGRYDRPGRGVCFDLRGRPTSLTLALMGGIVGAGIGARLPAQWAVVGKVLRVGFAAPAQLPAGWLVYQVLRGRSVAWSPGGSFA